MLIPGKVETQVFLLETCNLGGQGLSQKVLEVLIDGLSTNFSGQQQKIYYVVSNEPQQENKDEYEQNTQIQSTNEDPPQESQQKNQKIIMDQPKQPKLQQQIMQREEEIKSNIPRTIKIKESAEQAILADIYCQQLVNDTEQNKLLTHDEQGLNSSGNQLNDESL
ncbi:unnamed protein product [Paramecium octaurelia]|uniref:Uncharacterized protein n=1 Tax=Paramecium octaurelia TaxID=43137 RepID=A0A8S1T6N2_PAROT|nr:unnamed protein product [Paramecium octaurelia]